MANDPITGAEELLTTLVGKIFTDKTQAANALSKIAEMKESGDLQIALANIGVNAEDAKSASKFQSWWRPYLAWWCVNAFAYHFVVFPVFKVILTSLGMSDIDQTSVEVLGGVLMTLIGARTWDKMKQVDTK